MRQHEFVFRLRPLISRLMLACVLVRLTPALFAAQLNVVASIPDFGSIAESIGGNKVKVTSIAKGTEDPHFVDARPSFITQLNKADLLLEGGLDLEVGWLPMLVNSARNKKILPEGPGRILLSEGVQILDVPTGPIDRSMGDVHPYGNPHFWLDPINGKTMASNIARALIRLDPASQRFYEANLTAFQKRIDQKLAEWTSAMKPFHGTKVITYHKSFNYFLERFGLKLADTIEPKPGIEPSPTHIHALIPRAKEAGVKLLIIEPNRPHRTPAYVAEAVGAKLITLPPMVGGNERTKDYIDVFNDAISQIVNALKE